MIRESIKETVDKWIVFPFELAIWGTAITLVVVGSVVHNTAKKVLG